MGFLFVGFSFAGSLADAYTFHPSVKGSDWLELRDAEEGFAVQIPAQWSVTMITEFGRPTPVFSPPGVHPRRYVSNFESITFARLPASYGHFSWETGQQFIDQMKSRQPTYEIVFTPSNVDINGIPGIHFLARWYPIANGPLFEQVMLLDFGNHIKAVIFQTAFDITTKMEPSSTILHSIRKYDTSSPYDAADLSVFENADPAVRAQHVREAAQLRPARTDLVPAIARLLKDSDATVRAEAAKAIGKIGPRSEQLQDLMSLMTDPEPRVQREAIRTIAALGEAGAPAVSALIQICEKYDPRDVPIVQNHEPLGVVAVDALRMIGTPEARTEAERFMTRWNKLQRDAHMKVLRRQERGGLSLFPLIVLVLAGFGLWKFSSWLRR